MCSACNLLVVIELAFVFLYGLCLMRQVKTSDARTFTGTGVVAACQELTRLTKHALYCVLETESIKLMSITFRDGYAVLVAPITEDTAVVD